MNNFIVVIRRLIYTVIPAIVIVLIFTLFDSGRDFECLVKKALHYYNEEKGSWSCLHFAASSGDRDRVLSMLSKGAYIEVVSNEGKTPLYEASKAGMLSTVKLLAEHDADISARSHVGFTPLHVAAEYNHHSVVSYLLTQGASPNIKNQWLQTPLSQASWRFADSKMIELLIQNGADADAQDDKGFTPLHRAAGRNKVEILRALVDNGANPDIETPRGYTPLMYAAYKGKIDAVAILLESGASIKKTPGSNSALNQAKNNEHHDIADLLLEYGAVDTKQSLASINSAYDLYENKDYDNALVKLTHLIETDPDNFLAYYYRGRTYEKLTKPNLAIKDLLTTEKLKPGYKDTLEVIAWLYLNKKNYTNSFKYYSKEIANNPTNAVAYHNRAGIFARRGNIPGAQQDVKLACELGYEPACRMHRQLK